ncbi:mannose/cellobiose epimerase-like protein (N-acyl-D-glucosamine 2-epimerase family) [Kushneria sinocarnis]|uniref:Mannose/cellobiose epimerase-like protein (N-acyl-D-glucosamine 2-epimerase family) n=1 Tax=Kushneria sinocarnis TaxID=595502 RepID=A0A420WSS8_9GAMM|nr:AGE family epimerase/isomerase [Kushneria sinocarnis]RKQ95739.1 mannose/cellobiose epimerase-like protein (N-acyl-D-glucosamine 2-epimerase family) [Kushneria sinocarnis]
MTESVQRATLPGGSWVQRASHHAWLEAEGQRLLAFYRASRHPDCGFAALDEHGRLAADAHPDTMITARMTHCFALAAMRGTPGTAPLVAHGVAALRGPLADSEFGGWYSELPREGEAQPKQAYIHAFVALAAASAWQSGNEEAGPLLQDVSRVLEQRFWSDSEGRLREGFSRDWRDEEAYRGGNSNMHATEALLQLADVLGEPVWRQRACSIVENIIHHHARPNDYRVVEHFDENWHEWRDYNADSPKDPFRPYGATPGHSFEWARLLLHLEAGLLSHGETAPGWLLEDAQGLFRRATELGWAADGEPGLIYTHDWENQPLVRERLHWPVAEAASAAAALYQRTGHSGYEIWYRRFWDYIDRFLIDRERGSWWHELDAHNRPSSQLWSGKPDLYHAFQATLLPRLPLAPTMARAVADGAL